MSVENDEWKNFLQGHEELTDGLSEDGSDLNITPEKEFGLTLFSTESDGYFMVFNTQIDIFQFAHLLHYFFGIKHIEVARNDEDHSLNNIEDDNLQDEDEDEDDE